MKRVGFLTSGGDCQSLNATMRGVAKTLYQTYGGDVEIYGILEGYKGLIYGNYRLLESRDFSGILTEGGTIIHLHPYRHELPRPDLGNGGTGWNRATQIRLLCELGIFLCCDKLPERLSLPSSRWPCESISF